MDVEHVRVIAADSDLCPVDLGAYSSRVTMVGNATIDAARKLRKKVVIAVAETREVEERRVRLIEGRVIDLEDVVLTTREAFEIAEARFDTLGDGLLQHPHPRRRLPRRHDRRQPGVLLHGPHRGGSRRRGDGRITVPKVWCAHDCGRALNPRLVAGQIEGSVYMGIAEALLEDHKVNRFGLHSGPSLLDYRIPTAIDTPEIEAYIVESLDPEGPYGAKEAGEGPLHSAIPALANAIHDAVGIRLRELPFTPAKVLAALREKRERAAGGARPRRWTARRRCSDAASSRIQARGAHGGLRRRCSSRSTARRPRSWPAGPTCGRT